MIMVKEITDKGLKVTDKGLKGDLKEATRTIEA